MPAQVNAINTRFAEDSVGNAVVWNITAEAANARTLKIQFYARNGREMQRPCAVLAYVSSSATGDAIEAASGTLSVAAGTDGALVELSTDNGYLLIPEADGDMDVTITQTSGADTHYLVIVMPNGDLIVSPAVDFAA